MAHPGGRPTMYSEELAQRICEAIATSKDGLETICYENEGFPCPRTIQLWGYKYPEFFRKYMQARKHQSHALMDNILTVANDNKEDTLIKINRARVIIDACKITAARFNAEDYSDKKDYNHDVTLSETPRKIRDAENQYK